MKRLLIIALLLLLSLPAMAQSGTLMQVSATNLSTHVNLVEWDTANAHGLRYLIRKFTNQDTAVIGPLDVGNAHSYLDTVHRLVCDSVEYRFSASRDTIDAVSHPIWVAMFDREPTSSCQQRTASVDDATQRIVLSWEPNPDSDIMGYYLCSGSPCLDYDTVWGRLNTSYTCLDYPATEVHSFRLLAFDSCFNQSPLTDAFSNIVLEADYEDCATEIALSWNAYSGMPGGVDKYLVQTRCSDGAQWHDEAEVSPDATLRYLLNIADDVTQIDIRVAAVNEAHQLEAYSNKFSFSYGTADTARYVYISHASVAENGSAVYLGFYVDPDYRSGRYTLYRAVGNGVFQRYATIANTGQSTLTYTDESVSASERVYRYRLSAVDGCGRHEKFSNTVSTMMLSLDCEGTAANLQWQPYQGWGDGVEYTVLRRSESDRLWSPLATTSALSYSDDISSLGNLSEEVCYRVQAQEPSGTNYDFGDTAYSAMDVFAGEGQMFFPNAFTPDQETNRTFGPAYSFIDESAYEFYIYTRQGQLVFSTSDPSQQWDGTFRGVRCPQGAYTYTVRCNFSNHHFHQYSGTVLLIR